LRVKEKVKIQKIEIASAGNRTRAARVAGEHSTHSYIVGTAFPKCLALRYCDYRMFAHLRQSVALYFKPDTQSCSELAILWQTKPSMIILGHY